MKNCRETQICS